MRITVWDSSRKVNHLSKVIWYTKIITEFTRLISSTMIQMIQSFQSRSGRSVPPWFHDSEFSKMHWGNLSQIALSKMWLLVLIACHIFAPRKENKIFYISIPKLAFIYLRIFFFLFISTQFSDFAFLKIRMQITFAKWFNVLNNRIWSMLQKKILVNNFIKFLSKIFPSLSEFSLRM